MTKLWFAPLLLGLPAAGLAQKVELVTDRPDFTESASVPGGGRVQVEGGWTVEGGGHAHEHSVGEVLARIGIGERFEARIEPGSWVSVDSGKEEISGVDDASLGFKLLLVRETPPAVPAVALLVSSSVPTGDDAIGESGWQPETRLALGWDLSDLWSLGVNAGWGRIQDGGERFDQALGSVALGRSLGSRLGAFAEIYGFAPADLGGDDAVHADGGLTLALGPDAQLDVRAGVGLTDAASDWLFGLGFARRW
ncbi:MAG TPA: transporter [Gemmatimonadota bacterium]|nr:transporter [Gemmatimonadota bacterium]